MAGKTKQMGKSLGTRAANDGALSSAHDAHSDSPSSQAFAAKAKDLDALRDAVVDAAGVGAGLWLSYLFLFFYLFIAVAAVTHRDLFFENPVRLPFLNVELPLLGFFVLGPLLFLVLHTYVLLHFAMLVGKVSVFHAELQAQIKDDDTRARLRRQLPSNIFVQYLAGPYEMRTGVVGFMLRLIALISLVLFPIALLVFFQLQFLPYHNASITWWHRIAVLIGILLLWMLWPSTARGRATRISWPDFRRRKITALLSASLVPLLLVFTIATFPGEWLDSNLPSLPLVPTRWPALSLENGQTDQAVEAQNEGENESQAAEEEVARKGRFWPTVSALAKSVEWTSLHDLLVAGDVDLIARKPTSLWSNRLVLPGIDVIDHAKFDSEEKIEALRETLSLRGRRLEGAVLIGSGLRKADFTAARLQGADLEDADLRDAKFKCAGKMKGKQDCPQLQGARLSFANLQGVVLRDVRLQGADLKNAQLQGADLERAQLQGADLVFARLQGADLVSAQLQGADLMLAQLQGADLKLAQLQGVVLKDAQLQGADFRYAQLQGADLRHAQLQGADLRDAQLQGADLTGANVWLVNFPDNLANQSPAPLGVADLSLLPLTADGKAELRNEFQARIANGKLLEGLIDFLNPILREEPPKWGDEDKWSRYVSQAKEKESPPDELVQFLAGMACADSEGHIANNMALRIEIYGQDEGKRHYAKPLAKALLDENCKGARALTDETRATLEEIAAWRQSERHGDAARRPPTAPMDLSGDEGSSMR